MLGGGGGRVAAAAAVVVVVVEMRMGEIEWTGNVSRKTMIGGCIPQPPTSTETPPPAALAQSGTC